MIWLFSPFGRKIMILQTCEADMWRQDVESERGVPSYGEGKFEDVVGLLLNLESITLAEVQRLFPEPFGNHRPATFEDRRVFVFFFDV